MSTTICLLVKSFWRDLHGLHVTTLHPLPRILSQAEGAWTKGIQTRRWAPVNKQAASPALGCGETEAYMYTLVGPRRQLFFLLLVGFNMTNSCHHLGMDKCLLQLAAVIFVVTIITAILTPPHHLQHHRQQQQQRHSCPLSHHSIEFLPPEISKPCTSRVLQANRRRWWPLVQHCRTLVRSDSNSPCRDSSSTTCRSVATPWCPCGPAP